MMNYIYIRIMYNFKLKLSFIVLLNHKKYSFESTHCYEINSKDIYRTRR